MKNRVIIPAVLCLLLSLATASADALSWPVSAGAEARPVTGHWPSAAMLLTGVALQANPAQPAPAAAQPAAMAAAQATAPAAAQPVAPAAAQPGAPAAAQPVGPAPAQPGIAAPATPSTAPTAQPNTTVPIIPSTTAPNPNQLSITGLGGGSAQWTIFVLLTFLTLIPSILICMTPFARLLIVFHFLRQALGLQTTPSNQTLIGLSIIMTFFIMQPIGVVIYRDSVVPLQAGRITAVDAVTRAGTPMRQFMSHYVREKDAALFLEMAKEPRPASIDDLSFRVLLPAYILSELKAGFQIGAVLFLPFLVVDMVVASITTSVGMMQLPPVVISTPLKLLLFLMVDGWHLLIGALMRSFN